MRRTLVLFTLAAAFGLGACGYDNGGGAAASGTTPSAPADGSAAAGTIVATGQTGLGEVITDANGLTLYGLTDDTDGVPTCNGGCAEAWPPLLVAGPDLPAGLDPNIYSVVPRDDGTFQLRAGVWPLYTFAGDAAPGDTNGQGSGGVWFAVAPDGSLIGAGGSAPEAPAETPTEDTAPPETVPPTTASDDRDDSYGDDDGYGY